MNPSPALGDERDSRWRFILLGVAMVIVVVAATVFSVRNKPKTSALPSSYSANLQLSGLKMSTAENFAGSLFTYLDGTVTNTGNRTVTHATVHVIFKDAVGQTVQVEDVPLHVLRTVGPYPAAFDLNTSPLAPGQSQPFRLTFEHISDQWAYQYPEVQVAEVATQ